MSVEEKKFEPSPLQAAFFNELRTSTSSITLIAVAGSGKSTTCIEALPIFVEKGQKVVMLSFGNRIVKDLKEKVAKLEKRLGFTLQNVYVKTFHSCGMSALRYYYKRKNITCGEPDKRKNWELLKTKLAEKYGDDRKTAEEQMFLYGKFVCDLVGYAKGTGIGIPGVLELRCDENWYEIIEHHDMMLDSKDAREEQAIAYAKALLVAGFKAARDEGWYDFDDMIYMPLALNLNLFKEDVIIVDEYQDTNLMRVLMIERMSHRGTRHILVGDPKQAIFGFTGATNDAMALGTKRFKTKEMMLNVSYRCAKAVVSKVKQIVPYFEVHEGNEEGDDFEIEFNDLLEIVSDRDAILCRNVAPMVSLAFKLIAKGRACHVLGSEIGKGLVTLVKNMGASRFEELEMLLDEWRDREVARFMEKGKEDRAQAICDKRECVGVIMENLPEGMRSVEGLVTKIESIFKDEDNTLCLSSIHKAKGREWHNVVIYAPERMPSPWARKPWMQEQEENLMYVSDTRATHWVMRMKEIK